MFDFSSLLSRQDQFPLGSCLVYCAEDGRAGLSLEPGHTAADGRRGGVQPHRSRQGRARGAREWGGE